MSARRTARFIAVALLALVLGSALTGCAIAEKNKIKEAVRTYDELLPAVYMRNEPSLLSDVASEGEQNRILMYILYLKKQKNTLETRLLDLQFKSVEILKDGSHATVKTTERWEYRNRDSETGATKGSFKQATYESTYTMKLQDGHWVVSDLDIRNTADAAQQ